MSRAVKRKRAVQKHGPVDLQSCLDFKRSLEAGLPGTAGSVLLEKLHNRSMIMTASFAGIGTCLSVGASISAGVSLQGTDNKFVPYSATEKSSSCRKALDSLKESSRPKHLFYDMMSRMWDCDLDRISVIEAECFAERDQLKAQLLEKSKSKKVFERERKQLEDKFLAKLHNEFSQIEFKLEGFCRTHQRMCPLTPRLELDYRGEYWCEVAGTPCQSFTSMNPSLEGRWLVPQTKVLLCWGYSTRYYEPDSIMHECVVGLGTDIIDDIFCTDEDAQVLKAPFTREPEDSEQAYYARETTNCSLVDLGIPTHRMRQYSALHLAPFVRRDAMFDFESLSFRNRTLSSNCYLVDAGGAARVAPLAEFADQVTAATYARFEGYWLKYTSQCKSGERERSAPCIASLSQEVEFSTMGADIVPTLVRNSWLCDVGVPRLLSPCELFLVQGFPDYRAGDKGLTEDFIADHFPFEQSFVDSLELVKLRGMLGNCMHRCQIGMWLYFHVLTTSKAFGSKPSSSSGDHRT